MNDRKLVTAPSLIHTANVFLPGCLGPVKREVVLAEDHHELIAQLLAEKEELRKTLTYIRDTSDDWHVCEKAADALADSGGDIPDFTPGSGNKARRRANALGIDYDAAMAGGAVVSQNSLRDEYERELAAYAKLPQGQDQFKGYRSDDRHYAHAPGDCRAGGELDIGWWAWQASRAAMVVKLPPRANGTTADLPGFEGANDHLLPEPAVIDAIAAAGGRVEP